MEKWMILVEDHAVIGPFSDLEKAREIANKVSPCCNFVTLVDPSDERAITDLATHCVPFSKPNNVEN